MTCTLINPSGNFLSLTRAEIGAASAEVVEIVDVSGNQISLKREQGYYRLKEGYDISGNYLVGNLLKPLC